ncbi:unnamed protein product [Clavelina lepadiformis]|uniref:Uncharacterized protein n=1 Tax=Clavelina lepadiformis TaxID=159417 RepID=A0ABP0GA17_CLALP
MVDKDLDESSLNSALQEIYLINMPTNEKSLVSYFYINEYGDSADYSLYAFEALFCFLGKNASDFVITGASCFQAGESYWLLLIRYWLSYLREYKDAAILFERAIEMFLWMSKRKRRENAWICLGLKCNSVWTNNIKAVFIGGGGSLHQRVSYIFYSS